MVVLTIKTIRFHQLKLLIEVLAHMQKGMEFVPILTMLPSYGIPESVPSVNSILSLCKIVKK